MSSTSTPNSTPSTSSPAFLDTFMGFGSEVDPSFLAILAAQEECRQSSEERQVEAMWPWMEMQWEEQMQEWDLVAVAVNTQAVKLAGEKAAMEIRKQSYFVSVGFLFYDFFLELTGF